MADLSNVTFQPQNADALFSPDQWLNKFSRFNDNAYPWPSSYTGYPTDAMGNPITPQSGSGIPDYAQWQANQATSPSAAQSSTPGTTINSTPASDNTALKNYITSQNATLQGMPSSLNQGGFGAGNNVMSNTASAQIRDNAIALDQLKRQPAAAATQQAAPASSNNLTYPQVLALLANPGKVTTPGGNASAASAQSGAGVNNAFLEQAQGKSGMNQNFLSVLAALQDKGRG